MHGCRKRFAEFKRPNESTVGGWMALNYQCLSHSISRCLLGVFFGMLTTLASAETPSIDASIATDALSRAEVLGLYFTPPADIAAAIVDVINQSKTEVLVQAYGFTHHGIAEALVKAQDRGVRIRVMLDQKSESINRQVVDKLNAHGIRMRFDGSHAIAHNKVMIVDESIVITGSFNFTNAAQTRNAENLLVLRSIDLANNYKLNWLEHWKHSRD